LGLLAQVYELMIRKEKLEGKAMPETDWKSPEEFETIAHANKPFSLRVPALVVTRGKTGRLNLMLAMWFTPIATQPSSFLVAVAQDTQTNQFLEETGEFVIAAPEERLLEVVLYASMVSGKQEDKWERCGLTPLRPCHVRVPLIREALANVELKVYKVIPFNDEYLLYVGEVMACHVRKDSFRGGIYLPGSTPLLWLGKESGVPRGVKAVPRYAAGLGRIWQADEKSPLLSGIKKD
jgi:flavin reductase (DIM6/NTAB) family NADH-FMN oxidoreductase RutF